MSLLAGLSALVLSGCAAPSTLKALSELDQLCAAQSGYEVYRTVELPTCAFDRSGHPISKILINSSFFSEFPGTTIRTTRRATYAQGTAALEASVKRIDYAIVDSIDMGVLGRAVTFCGGGPAYLVDAPGTGRCCPSEPTFALAEQTFKKGAGPCK